MTFDRFCDAEFTTTLGGQEIVGLYLRLLLEEENLDHNLRQTLENLRSLLYENLSVEELENIGSSYSSHSEDRRFT